MNFQKVKYYLLILLIFISGNVSAFNNNIVSNDSILLLSGKVFLNIEADYYKLYIPLKQENTDIVACGNLIQNRINKLFFGFLNIGIEQKKIELKFISTQGKNAIVEHNNETKTIPFFIIKKEVILKIDNLEKLNRILELCLDEKINEPIELEYINTNIKGIEEELNVFAKSIINEKLKAFKKKNPTKVVSNYKLESESIDVYYPISLYKDLNSPLKVINVSNDKKSNNLLNNSNQMFYYGIESDTKVDLIINNISPKIGIRYLENINVSYTVK